MQNLVAKLNSLMNELNTLHFSDIDAGIFQLQCSHSDPTQFTLKKVTAHGKLLVVAFYKIPGIKVTLQHNGNQTVLCLTEKTKNGFKEWYENFDQIAVEVKNKILEEYNVVSTKNVLSQSAPGLTRSFSTPSLFYALDNVSDEIDLNSLHSSGITANEIQNLQKKNQGKKLKSISLCYNQFSTLPFDLFTSLMELVAKADVKKLVLKEIGLGDLNFERGRLLLDALQNKSLRKVILDNNNFETFIKNQKNIISKFLSNNSIQYLSLQNNQISDESGLFLAENCRIKRINLSNNNLSDKSSSEFEKNPHFTHLNFFANNTTLDSINKIDQALSRNKRNAYVEIVKVLAQAMKSPQSLMAQLPKEILFEILAYLGSEFKYPYNTRNLCTLIFDNIRASSPGHVVWKRELQTLTKWSPIFKSSNAKHESQNQNGMTVSSHLTI